MKRLLLILALFATPLLAQNNTPTAPTAPTSTVITTDPNTAGYTTVSVCASGCTYTSLNAALTTETCGSTGLIVTLKKGETYTFSANYNFPANNCDSTHWVIIQSDDPSGIITTAGKRIAAVGGGDNSANMPVVECDISGSSCWTFGDNIDAYWLRWFEVRIKSSRGSNNSISLIRFGTSTAADPTKPPARLMARHMYVHGWDSPWADVLHGIEMNCDNCAVLDSSIERIHYTAQTVEAKAIWTGLGNGPMLVDNNRLEGSTMNWFIGGQSLPAGWSGTVPSDLTITRNYLFKPYTWNPFDASYGGTTPHVKNLLEVKYGNRILIEGNVLENCFPNNQVCAAFNLKVANSGSSTWVTTNDLIVRYNKVIKADGGLFQLGSSPNSLQNGGVSRVAIHHNLSLDTGACTYSHANGGNYWVIGGGSADGTSQPAPKDVSFRYNTMLPNTTACTGSQGLYFDTNINTAASLPTLGLRHEYNNNILGIRGTTLKQACRYDGGAAQAWDCFDYPRAAEDGEELWKKNLVYGASSCSSTRPLSDSRPYALNAVSSGCFTSPDIANVQFTDVSGGDYSLAAGSPGKNASTDATDIGAVDTGTTFLDKICGAVSGDWSTCVGGAANPPVFTSITPNSGPEVGGTSVVIAGTDFQSGAVITIGGAAASCAFVSSIEIDCTSPGGTAGARDVVVTNPDTQSDTGTGAFTYTASGDPTISTISPARGTALGGTVVTITGTNFAVGATVTLVGISANCVVNSSTEIVCVASLRSVPAQGDVVITNPDTSTVTATNGYTYTKPVVGAP